MLKLTIHNDGKQRDKSFTADIHKLVRSHPWHKVGIEYDIQGYGSTQEEAVDEFKEKIQNLIKELQKLDYSSFQEVIFKKIEIWKQVG